MYNEKDYLANEVKTREYKRLVDKWHKRAGDALTGMIIALSLFMAVVFLDGFHPFVIVSSVIITLAWLGLHIFCTLKANKYHKKRLATEDFLIEHQYDYKNINAPHKEN